MALSELHCRCNPAAQLGSCKEGPGNATADNSILDVIARSFFWRNRSGLHFVAVLAQATFSYGYSCGAIARKHGAIARKLGAIAGVGSVDRVQDMTSSSDMDTQVRRRGT